jgi:hypothetical protein
VANAGRGRFFADAVRPDFWGAHTKLAKSIRFLAIALFVSFTPFMSASRSSFFLLWLGSLLWLAGCSPRQGDEANHRPRKSGETAVDQPVDKTESASISAPVAAGPLRLKLYLETSGSMFPYDAPGTTGEFKQTLNTLLNGFEQVQPGQTKLFAVNTEVNELALSQSEFIRTRNLFSLTKGKGKSSSTDFEGIFRDILANTGPGEVSVLVSDLIYSDPALAGMSQAKTLDAAQSLMTTVFNGSAKTHALLVVKLAADFRGLYYPAVGKPLKYSGERPYYLCFIGQNAALHQLLTAPDYATLADFSNLPNFEDRWFFGRDAKAVTPYYSILPNDPARKGRFRKAGSEVKARTAFVHTIESVDPDATGKGLTVPVAVDLSRLHLPASLLTDPAQYTVEGRDNFRVSAIKLYAGGSGATHKLLITSAKPASGERTAVIRLRRQFPPGWVARTATTQDNPPDSETTFGLDRLLMGVEQAYNPSRQTEYFSLKLTLAN